MDRVLHLFATTTLSRPEIARRLQCTKETVSRKILEAEEAGDERVAQGRAKRGESV